jgi:hypothetical protein
MMFSGLFDMGKNRKNIKISNLTDKIVIRQINT